MDEGPKTVEPADGEYLDICELVSVLTDEFSYLVLDSSRGREGNDAIVEYYQRRKSISVDADAQFDAIIDDFVSKRDRSWHLIIADRSNFKESHLSTLVVPDHPIYFGFSSPEHEAAGLPLFDLFSHSTGYEVE